jgi:hypothetical protein
MHAALLHRRLLGLGAALLVTVLAGCGDPVPRRDAPPGTALRVGGVSYDVRTARDLNPRSAGDRSFFAGVPRTDRGLPTGQVWLGVFLQAQNDSGSTRHTASGMTLADTHGHVYRSVPLGPGNDYAYRPETLGPGGTEPDPEAPASSSPEQGSLILFHLPIGAFLHGRPLELRVGAGGVRLAV